ncbi:MULTISPECIES: alpha/beta fold hydrolase [unclassified Imperialibacter]|uniref:alpha/beta fold hydrolase n=1 Tax=unclassified Imperialibacter TaxID=2629706 RepID=UPI001253F5F0|nr:MULTISPECIES: alpha/beta fold hydrolase [unclassified Imperialibacter]CAD5254905.1 Adenylate/guanylate cyclase domain-containing protein [Imperialibacter sp. 75]CAD5263413.1 Adenylate/guanylate cyclase domain-containing protein [Imperialibacter sp. 89]VVT35446.1 Adenylate/guanylate cyclase domain-containing protein [Imperialibacter sp. EC-SDR9]
MKPATQYTKSGRINIAYQVFGSGSIDLVYIPGWVSNIDWMWACPELVDFLQELGKIARVILFDKRGTGLSDRVVELSTLEERMDDIRAVMDAVGSQKAVLFGHSEGGSVSALFAATYPNRTISLITFGVFAKRRYAPDYPWAPTDEERQVVYDMIENNWGGGDMGLESLAPSKANDKVFMDWLASYFRSGASPSAAMVLTKMNTQVDIIDILGTIKVPTLLMQRTHDIDVKIEEGRFIAERIQGAKFVEFTGRDHLFWVGNTKEVLETMRAFILGVKPIRNYREQLFTIVAARIISLENVDANPEELIRQFVEQYRGKVVQYNRQTFIAIFEGPSKAVHCSIDLVDAIQSMPAQLAIGIHIREGAVDEAHFISGETEAFVDAMLQLAKPNQILVTQTVKSLLSGAGVSFTQYKAVYETLSGESFLLFSVTDPLSADEKAGQISPKKVLKNDSFLENVLQSIDTHLENELFGVEMLCREIGISERQLQRKLKAVTNKSPNQLITSVRLHRAKELLMGSEFGIAEAAFKTGFANPSYFSKCFKKEFGSSPSDLLLLSR